MDYFRVFFAMSLCLSIPLKAQEYPVDDSYTVSERFYRYQKTHPELKWPELAFEQGEKLLVDRRYKIADGRHLHLDVFKPAKANGQAIMFIHGGGWRSGNKSHFYALANRLTKKGYTVITPEYRLSLEAQYPAGLVDINDAILWAKDNAGELGFDPKRLAIAGGSSGGQMAALIGNTANKSWFKGDHPSADTRVNAVIDLDGVLDFTTPLAIANENKAGKFSAAGMWFGGAMEDTMEKWVQASAAKHIDRDSPPMLIISSCQMRFTAGKDTVLEKLKEHKIASEYYQYDDNIHTYWLFEPYVSETANRIDTFLKKHTTGVE